MRKKLTPEELKANHKESIKKWYLKNKDRMREYQKKWRQENIEHVRLKNKLWRRKWRLNNPEEAKKYSRTYNRQYWVENKDKMTRQNKEYMKTPKGKASALNHSNKRRLVYMTTDITSSWLCDLLQRTKLCIYCGKRLNEDGIRDDKPQLDHIVPIAKGGKHIMKNVQFICTKCNMVKRAELEIEFMNDYLFPDPLVNVLGIVPFKMEDLYNYE